jgi:acetoin utilization protein AcuB
MTKSPRILNQNETVERCAVLMQEKKISSVPIVDDENKVVGIMTDSEVFKLLINITGVYLGGIQLGFKLVDTEGSLKVILDTLKKHNARIISILTAYNRQDEGLRDVYIRIHNMDKADENVLRKELEETYGLSYWVRDTIHPKSIKSMA